MNQKTSPPAANRRTNLGILVLLASLSLFGVLVAIINASQGNPIRYGIGLGISLSGALALGTYAILLIRKGARARVAST